MGQIEAPRARLSRTLRAAVMAGGLLAAALSGLVVSTVDPPIAYGQTSPGKLAGQQPSEAPPNGPGSAVAGSPVADGSGVAPGGEAGTGGSLLTTLGMVVVGAGVLLAVSGRALKRFR
jgi:hypothetical protein